MSVPTKVKKDVTYYVTVTTFSCYINCNDRIVTWEPLMSDISLFSSVWFPPNFVKSINIFKYFNNDSRVLAKLKFSLKLIMKRVPIPLSKSTETSLSMKKNQRRNGLVYESSHRRSKVATLPLPFFFNDLPFRRYLYH